jgi:hypothetical protein
MPIRTGAFATSSSTRAQAGASYYGIMELSGNLLESAVYCLTSGVSFSTSTFSGLHGDGVVSTSGYANVDLWPGLNSGQVTSAAIGARGGGQNYSLNTSFNTARVADRTWPYNTQTTISDSQVPGSLGVRGVHTKPYSSAETK